MTKPLDIKEDDWQTDCIRLAHIFGWKVAHFRPARTSQGWRTPVQADGKGFPDLVLVRERVIFAELKADSGKLSDDQQRWLDWLHAAGAEVHVWRPRDLEAVGRILQRREKRDE
jgi:hypothetical protein